MVPSPKGTGYELPQALLKVFQGRPRIVIKPRPGLITADLKVLPQLEKLAKNKEFASKFEIMIVPKE